MNKYVLFLETLVEWIFIPTKGTAKLQCEIKL